MGSAFPATSLIRKELIGILRARVSFLILCAFMGVVIVLVYESWPRESVDLTQAAALSSALLFSVDAAMYVTCILFVPGIAGASIAGERERETLDMLRVTLIRPSGIVLAKMANAVGFLILLFVAALPAVASVLFLVGVDWTELLTVFARGLSSAVLAASIGVMCSVLFKRTYTAIVASYVGLFLFWLIESILGLLVLALVGSWTSARPAAYSGIWLLPMAERFILISICVLVAWKLLGRPGRHDAMETRKPIDDPAALAARWKRFPFYLIDPLKRKKTIEDHHNPVFVSEVRWGPRGRPTTMIRMFYLAAILLFPFALRPMILGPDSLDSHWEIGFTLMIHMVCIVIVCPAILANALTRERETGSLDMLRMTLLRPHEIVLGKFLAGLVAASPLVMASLLTGFVPVVIGFGFKPMVMVCLFNGYVTLGVCILISLGLGLLASSFSTRTGQAIVWSYALSFLVFIGLYLGVLIVQVLHAGKYTTPFIGERIMAFTSPLVAFVYNFFERDIHSLPVNLYWIANMALFTLIGIGAVWLSVRRFARYGMGEK